ncbi:hypothetical protein EZMO1_4444 [Endozoicomonas montiporae CL-33]|uniref:Uncharacterized protein n=1 Tax=Endozoicomonas montiporae CL-33 TaxID=570277 RepID=A0A142BHY4_9GAMM|nr:hypothetical protein EZMO1_4444 [Endozoicomonas montiporae CL-33]
MWQQRMHFMKYSSQQYKHLHKPVKGLMRIQLSHLEVCLIDAQEEHAKN